MVKTFFKILLSTVLFLVLLIVANALLPYSQEFKELGSSGDPTAILFLFICCSWTCFAVFFVIKYTNYSGKILFFNLLFVFFFVQYFMTQIETLFFGNAFTILSKLDIILLMLAGLLPLSGAIVLLIKYFQNKNAVYVRDKINIKDISIKLGIIGVIYLCVYMIFGYFVAWQFEELRLFYTGSTIKLSFWGQMANNIKTNPIIIPFQILRGILFGIAIIPVKNMIIKNKMVFIISVCLIYLCTAIGLITPNVLFPDKVRIAHLIEMSSSMLLFGIIVGNILWDNNI
jgi:hypothetical protein